MGHVFNAGLDKPRLTDGLAAGHSVYLPSQTSLRFVLTIQFSCMKSFLLNKFLPSLVLVLAVTAVAVAQGTGGPEPGTPPDPTAVPLDGGASLLLASGVAYGLKRLRDRRRKA